MGLGPPVCEDCELIMMLPNYLPPWLCPICGKHSDTGEHPNTKYVNNLFQLPQDVQDRYMSNNKRYGITAHNIFSV